MSKCPEETVARFAPDLDEWLTEILGFSYDREARPTPEDLILTMARHLMDPAFEAGVQAERERWEARIEAKASEIDRAADKYQEDGMRFTESGDHAASMGAFNYETRSRDVAKLIRALAVVTGKEGASDER